MDEIKNKIKKMLPENKQDELDGFFAEASDAVAKRIQMLKEANEELKKENERLKEDISKALENFKTTVASQVENGSETLKTKLEKMKDALTGSCTASQIRLLKEENEKLKKDLATFREEFEAFKKSR